MAGFDVSRASYKFKTHILTKTENDQIHSKYNIITAFNRQQCLFISLVQYLEVAGTQLFPHHPTDNVFPESNDRTLKLCREEGCDAAGDRIRIEERDSQGEMEELGDATEHHEHGDGEIHHPTRQLKRRC